MKKNERKLPNERGYGDWDVAEDVELDKWRGNLGTKMKSAQSAQK